jgi:RimJ/RimL family protein N-acetyltransferase
MVIETPRLAIRPLTEDDLEEALTVWSSNPDYTALTEGSGGEPGHYDLQMLQRDYAVAQLVPGRVFAALRERDSSELVGVIDWMYENPDDGEAWLGLIMIARSRQRRGFAHEAVSALAGHVAGTGRRRLRAAVIEGNAAGVSNIGALGFTEIDRRPTNTALGWRTAIVFERPADSPTRREQRP